MSKNQNPKIYLYLDSNNKYNPLKSEQIRQKYKEKRLNKISGNIKPNIPDKIVNSFK